MNRKFRLTGALALVALSAYALAAVQGYSLKRTPKAGDALKYRLKVNMDLGGQAATMSALVTEKVTAVDPTGNFTVQADQSQLDVKLGDQPIPAPEQSSPEVSVYAPNGDIVEIKGNDVQPAFYRMATLSVFLAPDKPVAVGDTWSHDFPADPKTGRVAAHGDFKVLGEEKVGAVDTLKVQATIKETGADGASTDCTYWINKTDGTTVKMDGKWSNVPIPGSPVPITGTVTLAQEA